MDIVDFREYCLSLPEVEECLPFDEVTLVFKVGGKMFAVVGLDNPIGFVVKCDPERAILLRDRYEQVKAAFHFNKRHWNSLRFEGRMSDEQLRREILHSYLLVVRQNVVPKARRLELLQQIQQEGLVDEAECQ
ncbi:MAG: MmcQ/YjbR family DNA-binding protein [Alistipes sp.]|nr:MmcQ/YjbR family DNA-binding protein [Rikenellaceae bacterium]MBQ2728455.1 MmcQ/YjbR family DNA-binding protein [Alistipes sp.]MBQ8470869.1 MmcQ/YjbR family DNA-binding protein [Alistipes sp.]MBQ8916979.1 MmcQ/YjbR family DNA-binding protein [Alistipes sp.]